MGFDLDDFRKQRDRLLTQADRIAVLLSGAGMSPDFRRNVFEPMERLARAFRQAGDDVSQPGFSPEAAMTYLLGFAGLIQRAQVEADRVEK